MTSTENLMNWHEAINAMRDGHWVRRKSEMGMRHIGETDDGIPIIESGEEACTLAHAWTDDERATIVFQGACGCLFVPDSDHRNAEDWVIVKGKWE